MSKITIIPKPYFDIYIDIFNLIQELKVSHEKGHRKTDNYYRLEFLRLCRNANDIKIDNYKFEQWTKLHREINFYIDIEMFSTFESYDIEIPDPTGEMKEKYLWITSEEELYQEVMKYYPKFKELIEKMKNEKN